MDLQNLISLAENMILALVMAHKNDPDLEMKNEELVADMVQALKEGIEMIPNIPPLIAALLESDTLLLPLVTQMVTMIETAVVEELMKLEAPQPEEEAAAAEAEDSGEELE